jgi:integrase
MMMVCKRGRTYRIEGFTGGKRVRLSLGTRTADHAHVLVNRIERALSEGSLCSLWPQLRAVLPPRTFHVLAALVDWAEPHEKPEPTWAELLAAFECWMAQRKALNKLQSSTAVRYRQSLSEFTLFLSGVNLSNLRDITRPVVESFKVWRAQRIMKQKFARGATSVALDVAILHKVFAYALEGEMIIKNPVKMEGRPGGEPTRGAQPFTGDELRRMRIHAGADLLIFLLLRHTGFRGSDAVGITWAEVHFDRREIERVTQKRRKLVVLPIHPELLFALEAEHARRKPNPTERVLLNPSTGGPLRRPRLYARTLALGKRAGVAHAHPHRFRDTLAVDLLCAGAEIYDVARTLGDTVETTDRHYAPFVPALRDRVRRIMEAGAGLESMSGTKPTHLNPNSSQVEENVAAGPISRILSALRRDGHSSGPRIAARL